MHELSIAQGLLDTVLDSLRRQTVPPGRLVRVHADVGELRQVLVDSLVFLYDLLVKDTPAEGSTLAVNVIPVTARCRDCGWDGRIKPPRFVCGQCSGGQLELRSGQELRLTALEIEEHDQPDQSLP